MGDNRALVFPGQCRVDYPSDTSDQRRFILPAVPQMGPTITVPGSTDESAIEILAEWLDSPDAKPMWASIDGAKSGAETYVKRYKAATETFEKKTLELVRQFRSKKILDESDLKALLDQRVQLDEDIKEIFIPVRKFSVIREAEFAEYAKRMESAALISDAKILRNINRNTARAISSPTNLLKDAALVTDLSRAEKIAKAGKLMLILELAPTTVTFFKVTSVSGLKKAITETAPSYAGTLLGSGAAAAATAALEYFAIAATLDFFVVALAPVAAAIVVGLLAEKGARMLLK